MFTDYYHQSFLFLSSFPLYYWLSPSNRVGCKYHRVLRRATPPSFVSTIIHIFVGIEWLSRSELAIRQ